MNFTLKFQLMKKIIIGLLMLLLFAITISCDNDTASNESEEVTTVYEGWTLEWSDEFNATEINTNNWTYELGDGTDYGLPVGWGNNEKQIYTQRSENVIYVVMGEYRLWLLQHWRMLLVATLQQNLLHKIFLVHVLGVSK
jgi:hypothetical protein